MGHIIYHIDHTNDQFKSFNEFSLSANVSRLPIDNLNYGFVKMNQTQQKASSSRKVITKFTEDPFGSTVTTPYKVNGITEEGNSRLTTTKA